MYDAYLDIETTGLSRYIDDVTVIGVYLVNECEERLIQLVGDAVSEENLLNALKDVETVYTYNGSRFDLPFIDSRVGVDISASYQHHDLMYDCWRRKLFGGLKAVEQQLGIGRELRGVDGFQAVILWWRYVNDNDMDALRTLLKYNEEDVKNLKVLRERLGESFE
ncbi:MAG: ribonuclease H-like domain-containing protein [Dehalococcoidia bacterium]